MKSSLLITIIVTSILLVGCKDKNAKNLLPEKEITVLNTHREFVAVNSEGTVILNNDISDIAQYKVVVNKLAYLTKFGKFHLINAEGLKLISQNGIRQFQLSNKLLATLSYANVLKVDGSAGENFQINNVKEFYITDKIIAYKKTSDRSYIFINTKQEEILYAPFNDKTKISNSFIAYQSGSSFTILDVDGETLVNTLGIVDFSVSDSFAAFSDDYGFLQIINSEGEVIFSGFDIESYKITNSIAIYEQLDNIYVIDLSGQLIFSEYEPESYKVINGLLAIKTRMQSLLLVNSEGNVVHSNAAASNYIVSNELLAYQVGQYLYIIDAKGNEIKRSMNQDMESFSISDKMISIKSKTADLLEIFNNKGQPLLSKINVKQYQSCSYPYYQQSF